MEVRYHSRVSNSRTTTEMNAPMTLSTFPKVCFHTAVATMIEGALAYVTCRQCGDSIVVNSSSLAHLDLTRLGLIKRWKDFPHMDSQVCLLPNLVPDHDSEKCEVCSTAALSPDMSTTTRGRTDVNYENAASTAVKMSKSAKKKRRKKSSFYQTMVAARDKDTASMEVSQSDSVVQINGVGVCFHEVVKFECQDNLVRIVCLRCLKRSNEPGSELTAGTDATVLPEPDVNGVNDAPDADTSELKAGMDGTILSEAACDEVTVAPDTLKPVGVFTTDANQVDYGVLASKLESTRSDRASKDKMVPKNDNAPQLDLQDQQ